MSTKLIQQLEDEFGSYMAERLYFDFSYIEAATCYLKQHQGSYRKNKIKKILNQFIDNHVTNQLDLHENPVGNDVDYCFDAWWKNQPIPRSLQEQESDSMGADQNYWGSYDAIVGRVKTVQDDIEIHEQMYGGQDQEEQPFKGENEALAAQLLSKPKDMRTALPLFRNVTSGQLDSKLESLGIIDKSVRSQVKKHILNLCTNPKDVMDWTDNELPLSARDTAHWINEHLNDEAIYMQDSKTWYYLRDNKYMDTPDCHRGEPVHNNIEDYYDYCLDWREEYPLFSKIISTISDRLQDHTKNLYYLIGSVETHTESEFNNNVLKEGRFCTPHGLYDYTHKISDSNGLTKVTTKANILNMTDQEILSSPGMLLFGQFMQQIQPDQENRDYLIGVIANAITGHRENEYTYILHGPTGSNGKSVLTALLQDMLGGYYADYNTDSLVRNSYSESPEQAAKVLENRRLVGGREIGDGSVIDGGAFKRYFSNDSYTINEKYKPSYSVMPTHTMFLPVNQMPNFGSDPAVRRRLVVIPFTEHFVNNPDPRNPHEHQLDSDMLKNLIAHEDEIFTYLVRYAEQLRDGKITLTIPNTVQHYGDEIVDETNVLVDFSDRNTSLLTEEQVNDSTIPTPYTMGQELYERFIASLVPGAYNPYRTQRAFIHAFLLKYPQLRSVPVRATDGKLYRAIRGVWLDPTTTAALKLAKNRTDDNGMQVNYPTFKANLEYQDWLNTHTEEL